MKMKSSLSDSLAQAFVTRLVCGCCGREFEICDWKEDYECPNRNYFCPECYDLYRPRGYPCLNGGCCKADDVGVNMYGGCKTCF